MDNLIPYLNVKEKQYFTDTVAVTLYGAPLLVVCLQKTHELRSLYAAVRRPVPARISGLSTLCNFYYQNLPAMTDSIKHVTDASFESDVLKSDLPVLVDYWAEWCGPCKMIAPLLDEAAKAYDGRVIIAKLNVDENPDTAAKFGIRGIPTLMLFKDGKAAATKVGAMSKSQLSAFLDESL